MPLPRLPAALFVVLAAGCGGGGFDDYNEVIPPGWHQPDELDVEVLPTDDAGRLYALVEDSSGGSDIVVVSARDGTLAGTRTLGPLERGGFAVTPQGSVLVADRASGTLHVVETDGFTAYEEPLSNPRALASWTDHDTEFRRAVVSDSVVSISHAAAEESDVALPAGPPAMAAAFFVDGESVAIARADASGSDVVVVRSEALLWTATALELPAPAGCTPRVVDVASPRNAPNASWRALDVACGRLYGGSATAEPGETIVLGSGATPVPAGGRVAVDGWTRVSWVSTGEELLRVDHAAGTVVPMTGLAGETTSVALGNGGTRAWVAHHSTAGAVVFRAAATSDSAGAFAVAGPPGSVVREMAYVDRPPDVSISDVTVEGCGDGATVHMTVSVTDPDGDPAVLWLAHEWEHEDVEWDGNALSIEVGGDVAIELVAQSGHFLAHDFVNVGIPDCASDDDDDDDTDDSGSGCACECSVASPRSAPRGFSYAVLFGIAALLSWRRRRHG